MREEGKARSYWESSGLELVLLISLGYEAQTSVLGLPHKGGVFSDVLELVASEEFEVEEVVLLHYISVVMIVSLFSALRPLLLGSLTESASVDFRDDEVEGVCGGSVRILRNARDELLAGEVAGIGVVLGQACLPPSNRQALAPCGVS